MNDLDRDVWCLLGLPFDAIDMDGAIKRVYEAVRTREKCFISTPNLNFLIASQKDPDFKNSVINSNLSVADGKPLIWIARILNIPLPERVAGSDLIEMLIENKENNNRIKVFFFGGQEGIAEQACIKLNKQNKGLHCVGYYNPGFGSVDDMSTPDIIEAINKTGADFVIVSLGAKKGQAWIEKNRSKLDAPVISHLGAVVNFIAGSVKRSPKMMQTLGLEWLWRIKEEPTLLKRYVGDGVSLIYLLLSRILPYSLILWRHKPGIESSQVILLRHDEASATIMLTGTVTQQNIHKIDQKIQAVCSAPVVRIDINGLEYIDASFMGYLQLLEKKLGQESIVLKILASPHLKRMFTYNGCSYLLT